MPLPVIFKFLSDTTGLKFNEVNRGLDGINVSSQKAGAAVRNFASIVKSGQEPVTALADSVKQAQQKAYELAQGIHFDGMQYRRDIGYRAIKH